jgi:hypothetical protein
MMLLTNGDKNTSSDKEIRKLIMEKENILKRLENTFSPPKKS